MQKIYVCFNFNSKHYQFNRAFLRLSVIVIYYNKYFLGNQHLTRFLIIITNYIIIYFNTIISSMKNPIKIYVMGPMSHYYFFF